MTEMFRKTTYARRNYYQSKGKVACFKSQQMPYSMFSNDNFIDLSYLCINRDPFSSEKVCHEVWDEDFNICKHVKKV